MEEREVVKSCRYYKSYDNFFEVCTKDDTREPRCNNCDIDHRADVIFNSQEFHQLFVNSSPKAAERALEFVYKMHKLVEKEEGVSNAETS